MSHALRQIRVGNTVVQRNALRRRLVREIEELVARADQLERRQQDIRTVEQMISDRCQTLLKLSADLSSANAA